MAQHTFTAFKWTGNYYNATYNTSYQATITDDDDSYEGSGDRSESVSIDGGPELSTSSQPYSIDVSFTDTDGDAHVETFQFFYAVGSGWYFIPGPDSEFTEGARLGTYQSHTVGWDYESVACFVEGTLIETVNGPVPVETLQPGAQLRTSSGQSQPLLELFEKKIPAEDLELFPKLAPIRVRAGALGQGLPKRDLLVSRQHRMMIRSAIALRMFGAAEVLVAAVRLCARPGVGIETNAHGVRYFHLLCPEHCVLLAEGAPSESLLFGENATEVLGKDALERARRLCADHGYGEGPVEPARLIPTGAKQKQLIRRHNLNDKPLLQSWIKKDQGDTPDVSQATLPIFASRAKRSSSASNLS